MKKIASSDLLASSMDRIISSEGHKSLFAKPQIKTAKKIITPVTQAFDKLIQASEKLESLGLVQSSLSIMALASNLAKEASGDDWDEQAHQELIKFLKEKEKDSIYPDDPYYYSNRWIGPDVRSKIQELTDQAKARKGPELIGDLMDRGEETDLDPEQIAIEDMEIEIGSDDPMDDQESFFDLVETLTVGDDADKTTISDEEEYGSLFEQLRGAK